VTAEGGAAGTGIAGRLPRLLSLVPYLLARPGVPIATAAADFGIGERQLRRDLELLWMCGLPGYGPGDLVDLSFSGDTVTVTEDAGMRRPLRLTTAEGTALLVALRTLGDLPGMVDTDAVRRATAKVERAVGGGEAATGGVAVDVTVQEQATTATVREALEAGCALSMHYYTAGRDAVSRRTVDPMRLLLVEGHGYLEAWCRRAEAVRLFRLDRVDDVAVLDEAAAAPPDARPTDVSAGVFRPRPEHGTAVLLLEPGARWIAEYYPVDDVVELPAEHTGGRGGGDAGGGRARVLLRYADPAWLVRLVLGLGGGAQILEPPELAAEVARWAREALAEAEGAGASQAASASEERTVPGSRPFNAEAEGGGASASEERTMPGSRPFNAEGAAATSAGGTDRP
jgi:proteasome accessory factor C